ncbi:hypothetical protein HYU94_01245 [Candidatus Daviesbacteria bacterium]|nr:hypothetical protein [Candidatus Daviesbacteria bacterium]
MQTVTVDAQTFEKILSRLDHLSQKQPPYGSKERWKWSDREAKKDIKMGKVIKFDSAGEAIKWLN